MPGNGTDYGVPSNLDPSGRPAGPILTRLKPTHQDGNVPWKARLPRYRTLSDLPAAKVKTEQSGWVGDGALGPPQCPPPCPVVRYATLTNPALVPGHFCTCWLLAPDCCPDPDPAAVVVPSPPPNQKQAKPAQAPRWEEARAHRHHLFDVPPTPPP